jgi:hypothetical protein
MDLVIIQKPRKKVMTRKPGIRESEEAVPHKQAMQHLLGKLL